MKIAIISDTHLGVNWDSERENDSFDNLEEAFKECIHNNADAVILAGDIFHKKIPKPEVWDKALQLFNIPKRARYNYASVEGGYEGLPVIAIHGTHELRQKDFKNPIQILDSGKFCKHVHLGHEILYKDGERVAIHGLSGVPEKYVKTILEQWNPKPRREQARE